MLLGNINVSRKRGMFSAPDAQAKRMATLNPSYQQAFNMFDADRSGTIDMMELSRCLQQIKQSVETGTQKSWWPEQFSPYTIMWMAGQFGGATIQFNQFCETMETLDPKAIAVFTEAAYYAAKVASEHVPTADQINSAAKASVDQVNRIAKNPNTSKAYDNLHYAATETGLPTQLKKGAAYAYSRLPTRPIDQLVDATAGLTHEQIKNVDVVADTVGGIHPETAGKFMELGKSMTTEQLRCLVNAANHMKPEDLMALKEKAVEYGKSNSE